MGIWNVSPGFYIVLFRSPLMPSYRLKLNTFGCDATVVRPSACRPINLPSTKERRASHRFYSFLNSCILVIRSRVWCKYFSIKK